MSNLSSIGDDDFLPSLINIHGLSYTEDLMQLLVEAHYAEDGLFEKWDFIKFLR